MGGKKKYINIFGSFMEPFNYWIREAMQFYDEDIYVQTVIFANHGHDSQRHDSQINDH